MKAAIAQFLGTNCDLDMKRALDVLGIKNEFVFYNQKIEKDYDIIFLPGGFSYGDYVYPGRLAKASPLIRSIIVGKQLVVGICNGFQTLCEANILPGALLPNMQGKFICEETELSFMNEVITLPIAHKYGNYYTETKKNNAFLKYCVNKNGSIDDIAGIYDKEKKVIGLMPHPERAVCKLSGSKDGIKVFEFFKNEARI